ncbi:hypothetical protein AAXB25_22750 [Paenibacillus lautus]|uniref:hypothetical protein n=1 Tax=Paenibacillus lautus TaxID=1401 RepID=UPI003D2E30BD
MNFEEGKSYNAVVNGQIWTFVYDGTDPEDEEILWITWESGEEEGHSTDYLIPKVEEVGMLQASGIVYPQGMTEDHQWNALQEIIQKPRYFFAGMEVPRAMVLTYHFAPDELLSDLYDRRSDYMDFIYDPDSKLLSVTTPKRVEFPQWIKSKLNVTGIMRIEEEDKTVWKIDCANGDYLKAKIST